jgi:thymidine phosphorylase
LNQDQLAASARRRVAVGVGNQVLGHRLGGALDQRRQVRLQLLHLRGRQGLDEVGKQFIVQMLHVDKAAHGGTPAFWMVG